MYETLSIASAIADTREQKSLREAVAEFGAGVDHRDCYFLAETDGVQTRITASSYGKMSAIGTVKKPCHWKLVVKDKAVVNSKLPDKAPLVVGLAGLPALGSSRQAQAQALSKSIVASQRGAASTSQPKPTEEASSSSDKVNIRVLRYGEADIHFRLRRTQNFQRLFQAVADATGWANDNNTFRLIYEDRSISPTATPLTFGMQEEDVVLYAFPAQAGQ